MSPRRSGPLKPCGWCRRVVNEHGERPTLTADFANMRFHDRCYIEHLVAEKEKAKKPKPK